MPGGSDGSSDDAAELILPAGLVVLSAAEVTDRLLTWAGRVAAGEAQLLAYLGEFDARCAWSGTGIQSCAQWMAWRMGMGLKAASERVRIARRLRQLPLTFGEFAAGRLSFTQVRAITRVAGEQDEARWVEIARHASGSQLERLVRGIRRARSLTEAEKARRAGEPPAPVAPTMKVRYDPDDGSLRLTIRVSAEDGVAVLAAVEAVRADLDAATALEEVAKPAPESSAEDSEAAIAVRATAGAGFLTMCAAYLRRRASKHPTRARRDRAALTVQIDPLSGWARLPDGELIPPSAQSPLLTLPGGQTLRRYTPADLTIHDAGRRLREPDQALRDLLAAVDGHQCRYPSCTRTRKLHAHHLIYWAHEGPTDLANLILVCSRHHTVIHTENIRLQLDPATRILTVTTATATPVPHQPTPPWHPADHLDPTAHIHPDTLPPHATDRLHLHYAVEVLLQNAA